MTKTNISETAEDVIHKALRYTGFSFADCRQILESLCNTDLRIWHPDDEPAVVSGASAELNYETEPVVIELMPDIKLRKYCLKMAILIQPSPLLGGNRGDVLGKAKEIYDFVTGANNG